MSPEGEHHPLKIRCSEIADRGLASEIAINSIFERLATRPDYTALSGETKGELFSLMAQSDNLMGAYTDAEWIQALVALRLSPDVILAVLEKKEEIHLRNKS